MACGRRAMTAEKGRDSTRYPAAIALATMKNLRQSKHASAFAASAQFDMHGYITGIVGSLDGRANDTDRSAGKSSKRAWNWKNWVKTESVSSEVPVAMAAARAGPKAATLSTKSRSATHRLPRSARRKNGTPVFRGAVVVAAAGTATDDAAAAGGGGAVATAGALPWWWATSSMGITVAAAPASLVLMVGCCVVGAS